MSTEELIWIVASGGGTVVGGLALLAIGRPSGRVLDSMLGFTAGVMLAAACFSLLVPAFEAGSVGEVLAGFLLGAATLAVLDQVIPHLHARFVERGHESEERFRLSPTRHRAILLLSALTIHNIPEGLSVGLAFAVGGPDVGIPIALAIGLQNVPEGFAAAAPLLEGSTSRVRPALFGAATGLVEPPAAILAYLAADTVDAALPLGLGFAAGAMIYVVCDELIPESHAHGFERAATISLLGGFALMMVLDNAFG